MHNSELGNAYTTNIALDKIMCHDVFGRIKRVRAADGEEGNAPGDAIEQRVRLPPAVMARARIGG